MKKKNLDVYRNLQLHLDEFPIGFPATKSGSDIRLLRFFFNPKEAHINVEVSWSLLSKISLLSLMK